jgi:hypothetical protein
LYCISFGTASPQVHNENVLTEQANALVCSTLVEVGIDYGLGRRTNDIPDAEDRVQAANYTVIAPNFSIDSTTTGKLSVAVFLLRLMGPSATTAQRWSLYILTVISIILNTLAVIAVAGFCRPAEKIWRPEVDGSCFPPMYQLILGTTQAAKSPRFYCADNFEQG